MGEMSSAGGARCRLPCKCRRRVAGTIQQYVIGRCGSGYGRGVGMGVGLPVRGPQPTTGGSRMI